ncbi:MAG: hypothetical protein KGI08_07480 [Thaumarchaeota archaeon]|nr:hypothetical protein [Nitrososphaerota archaeon]
MAEETQNNTARYLITHAEDGWVYQHIDTDYDEGSYIYQCPSCKDLIKVTPLEGEPTGESEEKPVEQPQAPPVQQEEQTGEEIQPPITPPRKKQRRKMPPTPESLSRVN